ncbi:tRNA dihydrouridine synthase DusB [Acetobacterium woodii]|uniref:tRNA-dihydrouridine synthase n=1 Tax=Acetobacterium woodii (strain ATCC 29683 / DSM 1030 / JCM 2381 / KCTC 1655 / WB1) TaxID=931626 RepID=H6LHK3_ACEWD|nr:tRNA dihydrouridine synthase DusB [Acetobacterium woodii]AFA49713.1 tRNA-dihydrouridine synthase Dus [Acetobacterium woodii DSM 1030]
MNNDLAPVQKNNCLKIGDVCIDTPLFLGPMAGYTNLPFRLIAKEFGAGAVFSEMVSGKGLYYNDHKTADLMLTSEKEAPAGIQLFGSDPDILAEVVHNNINSTAYAFLDFNAGCPAPKITKNGEGSALLKTPELLYRVVKALAEASQKPLIVKTRIGWDDDSINILRIAEGIEAAGAAALTIHGRTREAYYSGTANWEIIAAVKKNAGIPIILNGDINSGPAAQKAFETTGVDAVMIGRAAIGNPFIFREIRHYLETGQIGEKPTPEEKVAVALKHLELLALLKNEDAGLREMRKHLAAYTKGLRHATAIRNELFRAPDKETVIKLLSSALEA